MTSLIARPSLAAVYGHLHYAIKNCRKDLGMLPESDPVTVCGMLEIGIEYMFLAAYIISV